MSGRTDLEQLAYDIDERITALEAEDRAANAWLTLGRTADGFARLTIETGQSFITLDLAGEAAEIIGYRLQLCASPADDLAGLAAAEGAALLLATDGDVKFFSRPLDEVGSGADDGGGNVRLFVSGFAAQGTAEYRVECRGGDPIVARPGDAPYGPIDPRQTHIRMETTVSYSGGEVSAEGDQTSPRPLAEG